MKSRKLTLASLAMAALVVLASVFVADSNLPGAPPRAERDTIATIEHMAPIAVVHAASAPVQAQVTPAEHYHKVWQIVRDNFLYQDRLAKFADWEHKYDGKLNTQADAEKAINEMLDSLGDGYTYFRNATQTQTKARQTAIKNVVTSSLVNGNIGYIKIRTFGSEHAASETEAALKALVKLGAKSFVVDLRDNGGGYINQAFAVYAMFTDSGVFATIKGTKDGNTYLEELIVQAKQLEDKENGKSTFSNRVQNLVGNRPVVVLVNGSTASASEMLAGALRDNNSATLIGTQTFGKGIAQLNLDLPFKTSMQVTFAKLYQPKGSTIHGVGMTPDHVLTNSGQTDHQYDKAILVATEKMGQP
ncbi:MAG TPA: S41 family peptidase [Candidatus Obscuribacterales bacterium]